MATAFDYSFNEPILEGLPDDVQNSIRRILQEAAQVRADTTDPLSSRAASQRSQAELLENQAARILMANRPDLKNLTGEETIDAIAQRKFNVPSYYALDKNQKAAVDKEFEAASDKVRLPRALENLGIRYPAAAPQVFSSAEAAPEVAPVAAMPVSETVSAPAAAPVQRSVQPPIAGLLASESVAPAAPAAPAARRSQSVEGLLGSLFGGNELEDLMTPQQRAAINQRGLLAAAAALLQAGGPSTRRVSLGQALGSALEAGQTGAERAQQSALTQMLTKQKIEEAKREAESAKDFRAMFGGAGAVSSTGGPRAITPEQALLVSGMPAGPTVQRASLIGQAVPEGAATASASNLMNMLTPEQRAIISRMKPTQGMQELMKISTLAAEFGPRQTVVRGGKPVVIRTNKLGQEQIVEGDAPIESLQFGKAEPGVRNGKEVMIQTNPYGEERIVSQAAPYQPKPSDIVATEYITGRTLAGTGQPGMASVGQYREQLKPTTTVNVSEGQKGFENEMKLGSAFRGEPIYKAFDEMKASYGQVISALNQDTPIGDVAGATKIMKLLDPGSVVRESELGIAMAAAGRMDRLQNLFERWKTGKSLTPTQRDDFKALSAELYNAAAQAYNTKRNEYNRFGQAYGFKNLDTALGAPATVERGGATSVVRQPQGGRRPLSEIFGAPPSQ